jgi:hypothetical protein
MTLAWLVFALFVIPVAAFTAIAFFLSRVICQRYPQLASRAPEDFEELHVLSDGLKLRAWLLRGEVDRPAVVIAPGLRSNLLNQADVARAWRALGHSVLLLEQRGHGQSAGFPTLGAREALDVRAAMQSLRALRLADQGFILTGYSMGAAAVVRGALSEPDVRAVIAEAPYHSLRDAVRRTARLMYGIPEWLSPLLSVALAFAQRRGKFSADEVDLVVAASELRAPLFVIADGDDPWMPESTVRQVWAAHAGPSRFWLVEGCQHAEAVDAKDYWPRVRAFLIECASPPACA